MMVVVFGPVVAVEELAAVFVLAGHGLDVGEKTHRGVTVGMRGERRGAQHLLELGGGIGAVFVVLAQHGQSFGAEGRRS